jgi:phytoene synthase
MEQDLRKSTYLTMSETEEYMRGSAEVVGLMMARIMSLPDASLPYAGTLGRAYQYLNFVRDVREDLDLHRVYIPQEEILAAGLPDLSYESALRHPDAFGRLILTQLEYYKRWRREGAQGYRFIPKRNLAAIKTASDIFDYTAREIEKQPCVVLRRKVKPTKARVMATGLRNLIALGLTHAPQRVPNGDTTPSDCL